MTNFKSDFTYFPTDIKLLSAPVRIEFENASSVGIPVINEYTYAVDSNGVIYVPSESLDSYTVSLIDKTIWDFGDSTYSNNINEIKYYEFPGIYSVKLSIYSNEIYDNATGTVFRIINIKIIDLKIESTMLTWIKMHMTAPHLEAMDNSPAFNDLISSSSIMYDRMYKEINEVSNLMDIKKVAPKFLEFFSDTLNHKRFYAKKVGYSVQEENTVKQDFLNYDIFERIEKGIAGPPEISLFRQFIIDTASLFKQNGSKVGIENFFKLYNFIINIKELWTTNFSQTSDTEITDNFFNDPTLENSNNKFIFKGFSITGWDNNKAKICGSFNNLLLDNYHFISKVSYPGDVLSSDGCNAQFEINDYNPMVKEIFRDDGRMLSNPLYCNGIQPLSSCTSATSAIKDDGINIIKNENWKGVNKLLYSSINYKIWNAPTNYVGTLFNTLGVLPDGLNEIDEPGINGDVTDDYIWADWNFGVTVPDNIPGISQDSLRKPSLVTTLPFVNYVTSGTDPNLIQGISVETSNDFFIVARGFINVPNDGYYVFGLESGNSQTDSNQSEQQVSLFSLKHTKTYTLEEINQISSIDNITFDRDGTTVITPIGTTANSNSFNLYSKKGEYGIIELRQNQNYESSGYYYLKQGYYAFEVKAAYSSLVTKKLKLYWESYLDDTSSMVIKFANIIAKSTIPTDSFLTINLDSSEIENNLGKGYLYINNDYIEGGDLINILYSESNKETDIISGIINSDKLYKNLEMNIKFSSNAINEFETNSNRNLPQKTLLLIFRANYIKNDLYANIDNYYAVILNGLDGEISVAKIMYSKEASGPIVHKLNLNSNLTLQDSQIFNKTILDENGLNFELQDNIYYDIKLTIIDDLLTIKYRQNDKFTNLVNNLKSNGGKNILQYVDDTEYVTLLENILVTQTTKDVQTCDLNHNIVNVSDIYEPIMSAGYYGVAVQSSLFKIHDFKIQSFDKVDENLYDNINKYKNIKTKYLDSRNNKVLKYTKNDEDKSIPLYDVTIASTYSGESQISTNLILSDNLINNLSSSNVNIEDWGTRFNIIFNRDYLNNRFKNVNDVMDSIIIPYGNFYEPYINWSEIDSSNTAYLKSVQGGYTPFITENSKILPHTMALSSDSKIYISEMNKDSNNLLLLSTKNPLSTILNSTDISVYNGVWEEVCPLSNVSTWAITTSNAVTVIDNEVFEIIYLDKTTKNNAIGVKVRSSDIMDVLICDYCVDSIIWGLYEITLPETTGHTIDNFEQYANSNLKLENINPIRYFVPIGKLSVNQLIFLPAPEIFRSGNIPSIHLKGVYVNIPIDKLNVKSKTEIILNKLNRWESKYKSLIKSNYYIDIDTRFYGKITEYIKNPVNFNLEYKCGVNQEPNNILSEDACSSIPNAFIMPTEIINIIKYLEANSDNFAADYEWWSPKGSWLKRNFSISYPDNTNNAVYSGLNDPNYFFGNYIENSQGLQLSLDNFYADVGKYIIDSSWCVSNTSWDGNFGSTDKNEYNIGIFSISGYNNIGFDENSSSILGYEKVISIGANINAPLPLQNVTTSGNLSLYFGSYIDGESGISRTISPYGLYNWFYGHANKINNATSPFRYNWEITELNSQFVDCFKFNNIYGQIDNMYFKLNSYWSFYEKYIPTKNSIIKLLEVFENTSQQNEITLGVSNGIDSMYNIPSKYVYYPNWVTHISQIVIDNYEIPPDSFYLKTNQITKTTDIVLNTQSSQFNYDTLIGDSKIIVSVYSDKYTNVELQKNTLKDDFIKTREINWINLISENNTYKVARRTPDLSLKVASESEPFIIENYKGEQCYKLSNKFDNESSNAFSGNGSVGIDVGINNNNGSIDVINLIDYPSNNFSISCDVIFDKIIFDNNYERKFELILKAKNNYTDGENKINDFYFVGIGTYNFDIGLGMRSVSGANLIQETYLASYGNFNTKGIKNDTWYTVRASINETYINVYLNERGQNEQLVLHYNIDKKYEKLTERYLKGEFETLQSIVVGLKNLSITYPIDLNTTVSEDYTLKNFKEELAKTLPINGYYSGFRVFNPYTYITNVIFEYYKPKDYKCGFGMDGVSYNDLIENIKFIYSLPKNPDIKKIQQALNFTIYILINDVLYFKHANNAADKYNGPVETFYVVEDKIIIIEKIQKDDSGIGLNEWVVGDHEIIWSLNENCYNISNPEDFYKFIPNLSQIKLYRNDILIDYTTTTLELEDRLVFTIGGDRTINWSLSGILGRYDIILRIYQEGFATEYPILIKDKTYYSDELRSYMKYSNKKIDQIVINDNMLNILFKDI